MMALHFEGVATTTVGTTTVRRMLRPHIVCEANQGSTRNPTPDGTLIKMTNRNTNMGELAFCTDQRSTLVGFAWHGMP